MLTSALLRWYADHARDLPWRRKPFESNPYCVYVSEIMLQQTQVKTVIPYWERWMRELPTIASLAEAPAEKIHKLWEGLGYYTRVRNMQKAARIIVAEYNGRFPRRFEEVLALPGIGRYTAGAICSIAFNQPTPILDGNVIRVLTRVFGIDTDPREKQTNASLWGLAQGLVTQASAAKASCSHLNQSLMELGALICTPRQPSCASCPLACECVSFKQGTTAGIPALAPRTSATSRTFAAFVVEKSGRYLLRQRPAGVVNAHLWEFPNCEISGAATDLRALAHSALGFSPRSLEPICSIRHSITRYRMTLNGYVANGVRIPPNIEGHWFTRAELNELSFPSAHRKMADLVG